MTEHRKLFRHPSYWTYDPEAEAYYFAPTDRSPPPYSEQRHVTAILDIASDGTLAGIELIMGRLPPPPMVVPFTVTVGEEVKK